MISCATASFRLPLAKLLKEPRNYVFYAIGTDGKRAELYDEQKTIRQLRLFLPMLVLHEPEGNTTEGELNQNISEAMHCDRDTTIGLRCRYVDTAA